MFNVAYWVKRHGEGYAKSNWKDKPSPFARFVKQYIETKANILELGAGVGQDGIWFAEQGFHVVLTELGDVGLNIAKETVKNKKLNNIKVMSLDMAQSYPFPDKSFDVVYAHSCIQYFTEKETKKIFEEIYRVLKHDGILAVLVNSTNDLEYGQGPEISKDYFHIKGLQKRYYSIESLRDYVNSLYKIVILDERGETYKDQEVDNHRMLRLIAQKP